MKKILFSSLRIRIMFLVLLALLPALGLIIYYTGAQRLNATANVQAGALRLTRAATADHDRLIDETRQLLTVLAQLPELRGKDYAACSLLFNKLSKLYPKYTNLGAITPEGEILFCNLPLSNNTKLSDSLVLKRAIETRDFVVGDYTVDQSSGKALINFAYPVLDQTGKVQAVLFAALDLTWLNKLAAGADLPPGASLTVIDENGTVLSRCADAEKWVGKSMGSAPVIKAVLSHQGEGTMKSIGMDGLPKLYAFRPLYRTAGGGAIYVYTGTPTEYVFADADRLLSRNLAALGLVTALVLTIAWFGSNIFILRRVNSLLDATRRLSAGEQNVRTGLPYEDGEFGRLARAFDEMADSLEQRTFQLRQAEAKYELILSSAGEGIFGLDTRGTTTFANPAAARMLGYEVDELVNRPSHLTWRHTKPDGDSCPEEECPICKAYMDGLIYHGSSDVFWRKDGTSFPVEYVSAPIRECGKLVGAVVVFKDITERRQAEKALLESGEKYRAIFETTGTATIIIEEDMTISLANKEFEILSGYTKEETEGLKSWAEFFLKDDTKKMKKYHYLRRAERTKVPRNYEARFIDKYGKTSQVIMTVSMIPGTSKSVASILDISDRARLYNENLLQLKTISALYDSAQKLAVSLDLKDLANYIARTCVVDFGVRLAWLGRAEVDESIRLISHFPRDSKFPHQVKVRWDDSPLGQGVIGRSIRTGSPVVVNDLLSDPSSTPWLDSMLAEGFSSRASFPLISRDRPFGSLALYSERPGFFTPKRVEFFQAFAHLAAAALENARLFKEADRRYERLQALRNIDMAITASLDLRVTFNVVLEQVKSRLGIDAASILLLNPYTQILEYAAAQGFRSKAIERSRLRLGEGNGGLAVLEGRIINIPDLSQTGDTFKRASLLSGEGFVAYYGVPLITKGQVKGLLEIFHRASLDPEPEWLQFLETLAGQAAIAIDNAALLDGIQRSNIELTLAYDATIEGWSRALDMRDKETDGHSQRVTDITVLLARAAGINEAGLAHVRRGALLHDIGKMGIPDRILLKPGPLTEEEWEIMRRHPLYAYDLLSPIAYLRPALDIPYCHHEKWDGTGYPRGLKGEQIPLPARIFAVVDVWDALTSERPYRPAWNEEKVIDYLLGQTGKHFDPVVVELFMKMKHENGQLLQ